MLRKKILIHAYLLCNLGDDLFVRELCLRYPKVQFIIVAGEVYHHIFSALDNLIILNPNSKEAQVINAKYEKKGESLGYFMHLAKRTKAVIHVGGSSFVQHQDNYQDFYDLDRRLLKASKRMYLIGSNFGPYSKDSYYQDYYKLFAQYKGITLRDCYSYNLFKSLPQVSYAPDLLFGMKVPTTMEKKKEVLMSVIDFAKRNKNHGIAAYEEQYISWHLKCIKIFIERGYMINLTAFCALEDDIRMTEILYHRLNKNEQKWVNKIRYWDDYEAILKLFERAEYCIGTRFHSIVLGMKYQCKTLPVIYSTKTTEMLKDLEITNKVELQEMKNDTVEDIKQKIEKTKVMKNLETIGKEAKKHFQYVDNLLK